MKFILVLILSTLFWQNPIHALEHDHGFWNMSIVTAPLDKEKTWRLYMEGQFRYADNSGRFYETLLRPILDYNLNKNHMLSVGYLALLRDSEYVVEDRFFLQTFSTAKKYDLNWFLRLRFEERHLYGNDKNSYRLRALVRAQAQTFFNSKFHPFIANEIFVNLNETNATATGLAQNRFQVGLQNRPNKSWIVEFGYLGAYVDNALSENLLLHNVFLNLIYNFNLRS